MVGYYREHKNQLLVTFVELDYVMLALVLFFGSSFLTIANFGYCRFVVWGEWLWIVLNYFMLVLFVSFVSRVFADSLDVGLFVWYGLFELASC